MSDRFPEALIIQHHLLLMGLPRCAFLGAGAKTVTLLEGDECETADLSLLEAQGGLWICLQPPAEFLKKNDVAVRVDFPPGMKFENSSLEGGNATDFYSLHSAQAYGADKGRKIITCPLGEAVWLLVPKGLGSLLIIGTQLAADMIMFRQGDPSLVIDGQDGSKWGFAAERPNYLFEPQLPDDKQARPVDHWSYKLACVVASVCELEMEPLLPGGACGAIVVTGDDDQAELDKYVEQLEILDPIPITYFLHPLTRHDRKSLKKLSKHYHIELGLHPDALDSPEEYGTLFKKQVNWFGKLLGKPPRLVRNHGFLNDGYWGHLAYWRECDIQCSANLPGLDGTILNGSLLPSRVYWSGELTDHWSVLTPIGDGIRSALGMDEVEAADCILKLADRVSSSGIPGLIVLNLHPQNIDLTRLMHRAVHDLIGQGFVAMTLGQAVNWFEQRDSMQVAPSKAGISARLSRKLLKLMQSPVTLK